jgi:hypothetical protein
LGDGERGTITAVGQALSMSRHRGILPAGDCSTVGLSTGVVGSSTAVIGSRLPKPLLINQVGTHGSPEWVPEGLINSGLGA